MKIYVFVLACVTASSALASDLVEVGPLTNKIILLHFKDGYVIHHKRGEPRTHESVVTDPLDTQAASDPGSYAVTGSSLVRGVHPTSVGRKSKGMDFAWMVDRWVDGHAVNDRPDHVDDHWVYLFLATPMKRGEKYAIDTGNLAKNGKTWTFTFDDTKDRSEAVHVNIIGYAPSAPAKFAYVYQWAGDKGGLDFSPFTGARFHLIDQATHRSVFDGFMSFRKRANNPETGQAKDTPNANFLDADVYECDFSGLHAPGKYVVSVDGVGCSFPFRIDRDVYREPFRILARGLYQSRSGIALTKPYTDFARPAPHNPLVTPGFKGKLRYSSMRYLDYGSESGTADQIRPTIKGSIDTSGWYQDAGDWDSYVTHLRVAQELLLAYQLKPTAFKDGELNIPESGNGIPDILDEAAWLPRFCYRLRHELLAKHFGTGGLGLRVDGDPFGSDTKPGDVGQGSWEDVDRIWVASGEDPVSTVRYAGVAAQLAYCLQLARKKDPQGIDWKKEAQECYAWALSHQLPKDEGELKPHRLYAAAALFQLTGLKAYERQVEADTSDFGPSTEVWFENLYGPAVYALEGTHAADRDPALLEKIRTAILHTASLSHDAAAKRALRWGGNFNFPMIVGQQTTPSAMELAVARALLQKSDSSTARTYTADLYTTCDYFLGTNALNQTWVTGLGVRHPMQVFHMDSWYIGDGSPRAGIIPYGPWGKDHDQGQGPWDHDWANKSVYPAIDQWPGNERYFDNRCCPLTNEFTIHQTIAPSAAIFAVLCAPSG